MTDPALPADPPAVALGPDPPAPPDAEPSLGSGADRLAHEPPSACLNCGAVLPGQFCPDCGQRDQPLRQPAHVFIAESVSEYFGLDGRLWRSLGLLLFRPGALTVAYLDGRRTRYLRPLRLYLTATVLFFFLLSLTDPLAERRQTVELRPLPADTSLAPGALADRLGQRETVAGAEVAAVQSAIATASGTALADSLRPLAASLVELVDALDAEQDRMDDLADDDDVPRDTLVAVASLPPRVAAALADTGRVEIVDAGGSLVGDGFFRDMPAWMQGDLVRRMEETESPVERQMLAAQFQRAVLRQVPTALFLILPLFAVLLKVFYARGAGRRRRLRERPPAAPDSAPTWRRAWAGLRRGAWDVRRWRQRRRRRTAQRRIARSRARPVRGAVGRLRRRVAGHAMLRPWRVRRVRLLRRSLRERRTRYYAEHLVFALHVHAFTFLAFIPILLLGGFSDAPTSAFAERVGMILAWSIPVYFLVAQHRVYAQSWSKTVLKSVALGVVYVILIGLGAVFAAGLALRLS
ncbi:DUF3667 domain-containing protein [Rubrivirga sp.]|uniref:DUF3667 domain-containing protein n=1 Tax=Rubrivirga sp. TaxID=1885344 RepID=UPI003B529705